MTAPALKQYSQGNSQVSADNLNTFMQTCNTIAQLRTLVGTVGMNVSVLGTAAIGDGGGGLYYWSASSTAADNGSTVVTPSGAAIGAWLWLGFFPMSLGLTPLVPLTDFGGSDAASFDNTTALQLADASGKPIFIPYGLGTPYLNTLYKGSGNYPNRMWGDGTVRGVSFDGVTPQNAARFFTYRGVPPTSKGNGGSILTAFDGDTSTVQFPAEHWVSGATTLGQPAVVYEQDPECSAFYGYLFNTSGYDAVTTAGRTGVAFMYIKADNYGQGDAGGITLSSFVTGTRAGAVTFLDNPAGFLLNGGVTCGANYTYANVIEVNAVDGGFDAAGIGLVFNATRNVDNGGGVGSQYVFWTGFRTQSKGTKSVDSWISLTGLTKIGLDMTFCSFDANAAGITMAGNTRIYLNASATDPSGLSRFPASYGNEFLEYNVGAQTIQFGIAGSTPLNLFATHLDMTGNINALTGELRASGDGGGVAGRNSLTGTSDITANSSGVGTILFKGATSRNSTGFILMRVGTAAFYVPGFAAITG